MRLAPTCPRAAAMIFKPIYSFSINRFHYDTSSRRLLVTYYDGRQAVCADVPPILVAILKASSRPEAVLREYAKVDRAVA